MKIAGTIDGSAHAPTRSLRTGQSSVPSSITWCSSWLLGESNLAGKSAVVEVPMERRRAVLFGMRPQYRAQSYATLKMLFNAFLLH